METYKSYFKALTIAGSDSGGGAGIQADLKAFSANGVFGLSALTAITAQNTKGVTAIHPVPVDILEKQIKAVIEDIGADAVKIGMLHSSEVIRVVANAIKQYKLKNIVLDPVMVAASGDKLLQDEAIETLKTDLLSLATVITPNLPEAEIILNKKIETRDEFVSAAKEMADTGAKAILLKSGHVKGEELIDTLYLPETDELLDFPVEKIETENVHGTGCTLSSAIAAHMAKGKTLSEAVKSGIEYTHMAIAEGAKFAIGQGSGPVHHFYSFWK